ncbi:MULTISPECIES: ribosome hibernation promoting factor [Colwellia]|jgi:putative sigma-54 modulation protein|uniref:Ribosome hibernation promoting factor n=1 Tax=Colwellia hornerae TaxID=89402 RepID=A0A5C6QCY5_9GAMM|nr:MULTISPECIES: ribosome hibernation promoting factor [Colwellia]MBA6338038.1 ribosome hibernation promoting factor [Colwellia sp. BRX8-7]MBA6346959.1 ribosome hibernation promoting factor [Colwellia sp. BRX8-9]MBA6350603.1 ribosome hibernation promoting factor [Colwellia sp. BRX9-1]MBA6355309.1 ribosome hibernation promoting factor [Colwellia sp. BRX8-3]MBA6361246.1 ribosome hibernation promoting factor [Colwellia sp. BRX8-6]|tara:strand:- start:2082 stop:2369 length:288 start_codon:yes stop_codon:yes gene_type:complete
MQINLSGHHVDITEALRENVTTKMAKLSRHFDHINNVHVVLTVEKSNQIAEATVHVSGSDLHAKAENADMYASIDSLVVKLDRQILKYKGKTNQH